MTPAFRLLLDQAGGPPGPESPGASVAEALRGTEASDAKELLAAFRRAVHLEPNEPDYHYILGDALSRLQRHREALPALREAILMSPSDASYHYALGVVLWNLASYEDAAQALGEAKRLQSDDAGTLGALGVTLVALGRHREAADTLLRAIRLDPERAASYSNLGAALWSLGRRADALRALQRAVQIEPARPELRRNQAQALLAAGRSQEGLASLRHALRLRPAEPESHLDLADGLYASGRTAEAKQAVDEALRLDPGCLRERPATRERLDAMRMADMRDELSPEARRGDGVLVLAWNAAFAALFALARGFGRLKPPLGAAGTFVWYLGLATVVSSVWLFGPPYFDYFILKDRLAEVAGAPLTNDGDVLERLLHAVREQGLQAQVREENCQIETRPKWRSIRCEYAAPVRLMPGIEHRLRFRLHVERPYLAPEKTLFLGDPGRT